MVVLDFNINNMYGFVEFATPTEEICTVYQLIKLPRVTDGPTITHSVETALLAGDHHISNGSTILPPFWSQFNPTIAVYHLQQPICRIPCAHKPKYENAHLVPTHKRGSFDCSSSYIVL